MLACDWERPAVYSEQEVVARKEHPCVECAAPILRGERHLVYSGLWDGSWDGGRQHLLCRDACVWIRDALNDECIPFGALHEWWEEHDTSADLLEWHMRRTMTPEEWRVRQESAAVRWKIGARMYAMIRRRERLAARSVHQEGTP